MSEQSARAVRRELRRVAGVEAVELIDKHTAHIQGLGALSNANDAAVSDLKKRFETQLVFDEAERVAFRRTLAAIVSRLTDLERATTFRERLRRFVFGAPTTKPAATMTPVACRPPTELA